MRLATYTAPLVTVVFIKLPAATSGPAAVPAATEAFYERVHAAACLTDLGVVEERGDACICVAGAQRAIPCDAMRSGGPDSAQDQASRALAFAAALLGSGECGVGLATGEAAFLVGGEGAGSEVASVQGDVWSTSLCAWRPWPGPAGRRSTRLLRSAGWGRVWRGTMRTQGGGRRWRVWR